MTTPQQLRDRVKAVLKDCVESNSYSWNDMADAAIAVVLEEAAKVADKDAAVALDMFANRRLRAATGEQSDPDAECIHLKACYEMAKSIAAALRAMIPED